MKSFIFFIMGTIVGAAGGVVAAKFICDAKAESKIAKATIEARDYYKEKYNAVSEKDEKASDEQEYKTLTSSYTTDNERIFGNVYEIYNQERPLKNIDYRNVSNEESDPLANKPYISMIDPDEAGMDDDFTKYSLDYYQDGNLVDEQGNIVDNPLEIAGDYLDNLSMENPVIYVRNDVTKTEYDICYVPAAYEQPGGIYD